MKKLINPLLIIAIAVGLRLLPHLPNIAPIGAMALFGGAYLNKKYALIIPLIAMFISDIFLGFHSTMLYVYGSFLLIGFMGIWLSQRKSIGIIAGASLVSSLVFFIITNFGVWISGGLYPKTLSGLIECYVYALPFFRNTILGDLFYVGIFFGSYELLISLFLKHSIKENRVKTG